MPVISAQVLYFIVPITIFFVFVIFVILKVSNSKIKKMKTEYSDQSHELSNNNYELAVTDTLIKKIGSTLNIREVIETVSSDIKNLIPYTSASYILFDGNKMYFKTQITESVSKAYIEEIKKQMLESVKLLSPMNFGKRFSEENVTGSNINDLSKAMPAIYFNVPLMVNNEFAGVFHISSTKSKIYKDTDIKHLYKVFLNITKTITQLYTLIDHEKGKLQVMVDSMYDGVLMIDKDFRILVVNPACYKLMGLDENFSLNIFDIFDYFSGVFSLEEKIARVFATGRLETISELKLGDKYYEVVVIPVKSEKDILGVGILIHDQSKEMELKKLRQDFTAMMVHELRSPLSVIKGTSDLLIKEYANLTKDQVNMFMLQIRDSSVALLGIVNELLDAAKIEAGKIELFKKQADLNQILNDEFNYYYNLARDKGINFSFDLDLSIPKFYFDEQKVKQVMNNLLSNAIKFTESGGTILIFSKNYGSYIGVSVNDSGKGVPDDVKERLFQKFVQARQSEVSNEAGTGLGLAICKGIIDAHGGRIWVEDNQPKGAKFIFTIPLS